MRNFFVSLIASTLLAAGCTQFNIRYLDSGPVVDSDAGPMPEVDAGPPDAGPLPVELIVEPTFSLDTTAELGQQDLVAAAEIRLTARSELVWDGGLAINIEAQGSSRCVVRGTVDSPGEAGIEHFRDIRVVDLDTGETLFGPWDMPSVSNGSPSTGFFWVGGNSVSLQPDTPLRVGVTVDISETEHLPREVSGCTFRVYYGIADLRVVLASSVHYPDGAMLRPEQVGGENAPSYGSFTVDAVP